MSSLGYFVLISACLTIGLIMGRISSVSRRVRECDERLLKTAKVVKAERDRVNQCLEQISKMAEVGIDECKKVEALQEDMAALDTHVNVSDRTILQVSVLCSEESKKVKALQKEVSELYLKCKFN